MRRRKAGRTFWPLLIAAAGMAGGILYLTVRLALGAAGAEREYQSIVSLGKYTYDAAFLEEAEKIQGLVSLSPVMEIPIRLRMESYTMETVLQAVDLDEFQMEGCVSGEIAVGNTPVLLIGEQELSKMTDEYGHSISEKERAVFWESEELRMLEYCLIGGSAQETGGPEESDGAAMESGEIWMDCVAAGYLTSPEDGVYISYAQGQKLLEGEAFAPEKALLTVRGKENYEKAAELWSAV